MAPTCRGERRRAGWSSTVVMGEKTPQKDPDKNDSVREFYLAVGNTTMKLPTLRNLLQALDAQEPNLCALIVCSSRDTLDELASALTSGGYECSVLHSDMHSGWRKAVLDGFNEEGRRRRGSKGDDEGVGEASVAPDHWEDAREGEGKMPILLSSDVCLPRTTAGELRRAVRLLISFDAPTRREDHHLRAACVSSGGILINVLAANEASMLKSLCSFTPAGKKVEELPLILSDLFTVKND